MVEYSGLKVEGQEILFIANDAGDGVSEIERIIGRRF